MLSWGNNSIDRRTIGGKGSFYWVILALRRDVGSHPQIALAVWSKLLQQISLAADVICTNWPCRRYLWEIHETRRIHFWVIQIADRSKVALRFSDAIKAPINSFRPLLSAFTRLFLFPPSSSPSPSLPFPSSSSLLSLFLHPKQSLAENMPSNSSPRYKWFYRNPYTGQWRPFTSNNQKKIERRARAGWGDVSFEDGAFPNDYISIVFDLTSGFNAGVPELGSLETVYYGSRDVRRFRVVWR